MTLTLRIDNYDTLESGGPTWITLNQRGASIGRRAAMDWVLPDPAKHISGHHFDVAFRDGSYWLTDVSTNGTFLDGQRHRLEGPTRLEGGERLIVGHYVIAVEVTLDPAQTPQPSASVHGWTVGVSSPAPDESDPWDLGDGPLNPVNPLPGPGNNPHHLDEVAQDFVPLQRPTIPPGQVGLPVQTPPTEGYGQGVQQPPAAPAGAGPVSHPPFVPPPTHQPNVGPFPGAPHHAPTPQPVAVRAPEPQVAPDDMGRAVLQAFCQGAGLNPADAAGVDPVALAEALGRMVRLSADEIMRMLQDRANVKQFTRGGERTMRSATGNNPLKFLPDSGQALETMFLKHRDGFMTGPDGFENALKDVRLHQVAVFAALQPALARVLEGLAPDDIEGRDTDSSAILGSGRGRHWDTFVKRWDEKAGQGDHGMLDAFLQAFSEAYMEASKSTSA